jgi:hypothetical protein
MIVNEISYYLQSDILNLSAHIKSEELHKFCACFMYNC